jgi:hypothetical protein
MSPPSPDSDHVIVWVEPDHVDEIGNVLRFHIGKEEMPCFVLMTRND